MQTATPSREARSNQHGQTLVIFVVALVAIVAAVGLVLDGGGAFAQQRDQQKAADMAALAGAVAEANGSLRADIIQAATNSAVANGYLASEVTVNIPPTQGKYSPTGSDPSTNDCTTTAKVPCFIEVMINRSHRNGFAGIVGQSSWPVSARGVSVGGIANTVQNGVSPIMFNQAALQDADLGTAKWYCDPSPSKCVPNNPQWPSGDTQYAWTTFCAGPTNCNVDSNTAKQIIDGSNVAAIPVYLDMYLGPHNSGQKTSVCHELQNQYPSGGDLSVAINDDSGHLVAFWIWHLVSTDCEGSQGERINGYFVSDATSTLPLTITPGGGTATYGEPIAELVE